MKQTIFLILLLGITQIVFSQNDCSTAYQYCGNNVTVPLANNVADMGNINCLATSPNAGWYFFQVEQGYNGDINLIINGKDQSLNSGIDIDVIVFGPLPEFNCANILADISALPVRYCNYSTSTSINYIDSNLQTGEYYFFLVTNFSNQVGFVELISDSSGISFVQNNCITYTENNDSVFNVINFNTMVTDYLTVSNLPEYLTSKITIYDLSGKMVSQRKCVGNNEIINFQNIQSGTYLMEINIDQKKMVSKIFKI